MLYFLSADSFLGKIDKHSLSEQTFMELFIEGITNKELICGSNKNLKDISKWVGIEYNDANEAIYFHWSTMFLKGSIDLKWLPFTTLRVYVDTNTLGGTVDLTCLPDGLDHLHLERNAFEGTVDLTHLPESMKRLFLNDTNLSGKADFSHLPKSLKHLDVRNTQLEGEVLHLKGRLMIDGSQVKDRRGE